MATMQQTTKYLCENIQGCVFGYTQSDEITLILIDYQTLETSAWLDYEVQKMCSISASMATMAFNRYFTQFTDEWVDNYYEAWHHSEDEENIYGAYFKAREKGAMFDARCFNIPKEEVCNLIYWRQIDAMRNSVQMCGQSYFSSTELQNKTCSNIKEMLLSKVEFNWDSLPTNRQVGTACIKLEKYGWALDATMPLVKGSDREYVNKCILYDDK